MTRASRKGLAVLQREVREATTDGGQGAAAVCVGCHSLSRHPPDRDQRHRRRTRGWKQPIVPGLLLDETLDFSLRVRTARHQSLLSIGQPKNPWTHSMGTGARGSSSVCMRLQSDLMMCSEPSLTTSRPRSDTLASKPKDTESRRTAKSQD